MKKILAAFLVVLSLAPDTFAQDILRPRTLGISFILNDFISPQRFRTTSFSSVVRNDQFAKFKEMSPGIAVTYSIGLKKNIDFASTLAGSFVNYPFPGRAPFSGDAFLVEADASVNLKLFSEGRYWVNPYVSAGVGASKYKSYYGAIIPIGAGLQVNFFNEAFLHISTQYRIPVTSETTNYHLMTSLGIAGVIGGGRKN